jgi:hypothetical protein
MTAGVRDASIGRLVTLPDKADNYATVYSTANNETDDEIDDETVEILAVRVYRFH